MTGKTYNRLKPSPQTDSLKVPEETRIFYSWVENILTFSFSLFFIILALYSLYSMTNYISTIIVLLVAFAFGWKSINKLTRRTPVIILNQQGIKIKDSNIYKWELVNRIEIEKEEGHKYISHTLRVFYGHKLNPSIIQGNDIILLDGLSKSTSRIEYLIDIYRLRHKNNLPQQLL